MPELMATMQSFNYMINAMTHVFKHLKVHELLAASRVCNAWNLIAMNRNLVSIVFFFLLINLMCINVSDIFNTILIYY